MPRRGRYNPLVMAAVTERRTLPTMAKKQPPFKTEARKAEWWAKNQNLISDRFEQAKAAGSQRSVSTLSKRRNPSRVRQVTER